MSNYRGDNSMSKQINDKTNEYGNRRRMNREQLMNQKRQLYIDENSISNLEDFIRTNGIDEDDINGITKKDGSLYAESGYKKWILDDNLQEFWRLCYSAGLRNKTDILNFVEQVKAKYKNDEPLIDDLPDFIPQNLIPPEENKVSENIQQQLAVPQLAIPQNNIPQKEVNLNLNNQNLILPKSAMQDVDNRKEQLKQLRYNKALERANNMQLDELKQRYAKNAAQGKIKMQGGNPKIKFADDNAKGAWNLAELDQENWGRITGTKGNDWINTFNKAHDFSYNPKMLDPQYAAWHGAKYGTTVYQGDVNNDGISDIIEVDEDDKIRTFNGYKIGPSKQKLYQEFYNTEANKAVGKNGKPYYPVKFDNWYQARSSQLSADERKTLNTDLSKKGMHGYKVKETTINEHIKNVLKNEAYANMQMSKYDYCIGSLAQTINYDPKVVKRSLPMSSVVGQFVRAVLFKLFNIGTSGNRETDDAVIGKLSRVANSKKYGLKTNIINQILAFVNNPEDMIQIVSSIWTNLVINKNYTACQQALINNIPVDQNLTTACQQAIATANTSSTKRSQAIAADRQYKTNPMAVLNNIPNWY